MNIFSALYFFIFLLNNTLHHNFAESLNTDLNLYVFLKYLDVGSLSRLLSFKNYISNKNYELRPNFGPAYVYHDKGVTRWTMRLGMYGYGIVGVGMRGDGNCMFYTICSILKMNKIDNRKLLQNLNPDLEPAVKIAVMGILEEEEYITPLNLKRLVQIQFVGMDPYDEDSIALYDPEGFKKRAYPFVDLQQILGANNLGDDAVTLLNGIDIVKYYNKVVKGEDILGTIRELYDKINELLYERHGDNNDKTTIERLFQMRMLYFNRKSTTINCGTKELDYNTKLVLTMLYEDGCHFDLAGIYKLGTTDLTDVKSAYHVSEIPIPILLMLAEDCGL